MTISDAGAPVHHRNHARYHLAAVAVGLGAFFGSGGTASARPLPDWVPKVAPSAPASDWREVAALLPGSMVHERNALLDGPGAENRPHVYVSARGSVGEIDSATRSYLARGRAAQQERLVISGRSVERGDAKDHPGYAGSRSVSVERGDAKDHPGYAGSRSVRGPVHQAV